jgi:hypothetical protein
VAQIEQSTVIQNTVRASIREAGYYVAELVRIYPPRHPGGDQEVLFKGHLHGKNPDECLTAYVQDLAEPEPATVSASW